MDTKTSIILYIGFISSFLSFHVMAYPNYSLQNMPRTGFSCRDKILGGYYADSETQCQMFHVCVKVAGVGIQDFRFLCPNGTSFDQEAQICADWGDVDCEAATLYYGSDNFDLYRIGSAFESKRAPFAEEDESLFHLQRAETGDARRSKQFIVNQNSQQNLPQLTSFQTKKTTFSTTARIQTTSSTTRAPVPKVFTTTLKRVERPLTQHFTTTEYSIKTSEKSSNFDEIFKGSHSSNFFENKNNGKEDFENVQPTIKPAYNPKTRNRGRSNYRSSLNKENNDLPIFTYTTTTIPSTLSNKITRRINVDPINSERPFTSTAKPYNPYSLHITKVTSTAAPFKINYVENLQLKKNVQDSFLDEPKVNRSKTNSLVTNPTTVNHLSFNLNSRFSEDLSSIQNSHYFIKNSSQINNNKLAVTHPTTTLQLISSQKSFDKPTHQHEQNLQNFQQTTKIEVPQRFNHLTQKYEKVIQHQNNSQIEPYDLQNESSKVFAPRQNLFNLQNKSLSNPSSISIQSVLPVHQAQLFAPRGFVQNQAFEETFKTISRSDINTPSSLKKFSTLVPRDAYFPTTFKPSVSFKESFVDPIKQDRLKTTPLSTTPIVVRATRTTTTGKPFLEHDIVDSEDGQYHPEIYEKSFYRNKVKPYNNLQKKTTRKPIFNSGEDELLKAEHSQNIAAGANDLLLEKRKQQAGKLSEFISSANEASPRPFSKPKILMTTQKTVTSTTSPKTTNSDTYDYQYYDSDSHSSHNEYTEYGLNEDFVKTIKKT